MTRYGALLRGVNVGGINLKMTDVSKVFAAQGLEHVKTVLASGNVLFDSAEQPLVTKPVIEKALRDAFGYEAWVHVLPIATIASIVDAFPFDAEREDWHPYVIFCPDEEPRQSLLALADELDPDLESLAPGDGVLYWTVQRGNTLHSVVGKASSKPRFKESTTTRNLRTLQKLLR